MSNTGSSRIKKFYFQGTLKGISAFFLASYPVHSKILKFYYRNPEKLSFALIVHYRRDLVTENQSGLDHGSLKRIKDLPDLILVQMQVFQILMRQN